MVHSWRSIMYRASEVLKRACCNDRSLDIAVNTVWSSFRPKASWKSLDGATNYWLMNITHDEDVVHFNLLTGELKVNGSPLTQLPQNYIAHATYRALFKEACLEATSTNVSGMQFAIQQPYHEYDVVIGLQGTDLLVRAFKDATRFDLIPANVFQDLLPREFITNVAHWYNHTDKVVEFRPLSRPWLSTAALWRLKKEGSTWRLSKSGSILINLTSDIASKIAKILSPIESHENVHIILNHSTGVVAIELPRYQINFYLGGDGNLYSQHYQGMMIDSDQCLGSLVGLSSILVLRHKSNQKNRMALIPEGNVQFTRQSNHVQVRVDLGSAKRVRVYQIDTILGRIMDDGSIQSKLFLAYLHAITSFCLPDPLTGYTGTEGAIAILNSGALRSFDILDSDQVSTLKAIADITPLRTYHPYYDKVMQKVEWSNKLSFLSQNSYFYLLVEDILDQARHQRPLHSPETSDALFKLNLVTASMKEGFLQLLKRDLYRSSLYYPVMSEEARLTTEIDKIYFSRDKEDNLEEGKRSLLIAKLVLRDEASLHSPLTDTDILGLRKKYWDSVLVKGPKKRLERSRLTYDAEWLETPTTFMRDSWCDLHSTFQASRRPFDRYKIMMWLSTLAFGSNCDMVLVQTLFALYKFKEVSSIPIPKHSRFDLSKGFKPDTSDLMYAMESAKKSFQTCTDYSLPRRSSESTARYTNRRRKLFQSGQTNVVVTWAKALVTQWPNEIPQDPVVAGSARYIDTAKAMKAAVSIFKKCHKNVKFDDYIESIAQAMQQRIAISVSGLELHRVLRPIQGYTDKGMRYIDEGRVVGIPPPRLPVAPSSAKAISIARQGAISASTWGSHLEDSTAHVRDCILVLQHAVQSSLLDQLQSDRHQNRCVYNQLLPRLTLSFFLKQLNKTRWDTLSPPWQSTIISLGIAVTQLHRAQRILHASDIPQDLASELRYEGHTNWQPNEFPETLLLEVESGILVREVQEEIASYMRAPPNKHNSVMQLNMGEGKSSVIVPMIAAHLANGSQLVRVIVSKPQSRQMFEMLCSKLGGLLNRRIYHLPFSRALKLGLAQVEYIEFMLRECVENRGILLTQPEHTLSLQLGGVECLLNEKEAISRSLINTQLYLDNHARDIVDESDENFAVNFELVYTMGTQQPIELSPERWSLIHSILSIVTFIAAKSKSELSSAIEFDDREPGRVPRIRFLQKNAGSFVMNRVARHICDVGFLGFPIARQAQSTRDAVCEYITTLRLTDEEISAVEKGGFWSASTRETLFLLRGLLAGGILEFAYGSKRWRVDYGLDLDRIPKIRLAVPYRAKDRPAERSEFSHPDVVIVLTSLSYYYDGLSDNNMGLTFEHLRRSEQPDVEYSGWLDKQTIQHLPQTFHNLSGINFDDHDQCVNDLFPKLRFSKGAIDYFLAQCVFPKESREFPSVLAASGWDLGRVKTHPLTGFSGTNDSREVLPLGVNYVDLPSQSGTNETVLASLRSIENSVEILPSRPASVKTDAENILSFVNGMQRPTRVIIDVGAQILELDNYQFAVAWLEGCNDPTVKAVVFFNAAEEISVIDRTGRVEALQISPYAGQLGACLIYLDQCHARGIDLKLPSDYRAAVTLGSRLTKDRLAQACMRMRKLGKGQTVAYLVPEEIKTQICDMFSSNNDHAGIDINVHHVIEWAMAETREELERIRPLWAAQGKRFEAHKHLYGKADLNKEEAGTLLEADAPSLETRYRPKSQADAQATRLEGFDMTNPNIAQIVERCESSGTINFNAASLQEEQERELAPEIEAQRQVERPTSIEPESHSVHPDLRQLVTTGRLKAHSSAFTAAFRSLKSTSAAKTSKFNLKSFPQELLVSDDFARTVKHTTTDSNTDAYQRPVQFILSTRSPHDPERITNLILLSPYEANALIPLIIKKAKVTLHLYAPRLNSTYDPLDSLDLYTMGLPFTPTSVPRSLIVQLNLFSGQLYFASYAEYVEFCDFLGLAYMAAQEGEEIAVDGFRLRGKKGGWGLRSSPIQFLKLLATKVRRNGEGIEKTHLGRILEGGLLEERDFE